ncbi:hypothetical protein ACGFNU_21385 [Spirillospora sp. NPDC048911]|uniref:hypothetical protein n=1 Tax=Spirillospora sp. NPDC048911 TaxID=3364527 RepID=UPI00371E25FF
MHRFSVNYRTQEGHPSKGQLVNRGFWIRDLPRPLVLCRTFGHQPTVDGCGSPGERGHVARWVTCSRCGERPEPQGNLDPARWDIGVSYTGGWKPTPPGTPETLKSLFDGDGLSNEPAFSPPGSWPTNPTWVFGGQIIIGPSFDGASVEMKVGNAGSEQPLAGHVRLNPLGALYLHSEKLGRGIQRRLNSTGYDSRVVGVDVSLRRLTWKLWAKRDSWSKEDPCWQQGSVSLDPLAKAFGQRQYWYTDVDGPVDATVRLPHGDDYTVTLKLQRCELGRPKLRRRHHSWTVDWTCRGGIATKPGDRGRISGGAVEVTASSVQEGSWPLEATAALAQNVTQQRTRYGFCVASVEASGDA